jgi:hypothetical protein
MGTRGIEGKDRGKLRKAVIFEVPAQLLYPEVPK